MRTVGNRPNNVTWTFWDAPSQYFGGQGGSYNATNDEGEPFISPDGEVSLVPRIDSYYNRGNQGGSYLRFDSTLADGLYASQWSYALSHQKTVKLVLIYSWNEYHERTEIEPHNDSTASVSDAYLLNMTRSYVAQLG